MHLVFVMTSSLCYWSLRGIDMIKMKCVVLITCIVLSCSTAIVLLHGEKKDPLIVNMELKRFFPSEKEDNERVFLAQPWSMARDIKGYFYVYDNKEKTIAVFDPAGNFVSKIGRRGQGPGEFLYIRRIIPEGDNLTILDSTKHELCLLNSEGRYLNSTKLFRSYSDFALDHNGRVYCALESRAVNSYLVDVLDESGQLLYSFGNPIRRFKDSSDSYLNETKIVCDGNCVTLLFITIPLIQQYDLNGKLVREWSFEELPRIKQEEKENLIRIKNMIPGKTSYSHISDAIRHEKESYYVLRNVGNGLEIIKLNSNLKFDKVYVYKDINESFYLALDFYVRHEDTKPTFYIVRILPYARIEVICPP